MAERKPGKNRPGNETGELFQQTGLKLLFPAVGKLRKNNTREFLRNPGEAQLSQVAVELPERFADIFDNQNFSFQVRQKRRSAKRRQQSQIHRNNPAGGCSSADLRQRIVLLQFLLPVKCD